MNSLFKKLLPAAAALLLLAPCAKAQDSGSVLVDILDILLDGDTADHKYVDAGGTATFTVPKDVLSSAVGDFYLWTLSDYEKVDIVTSSRNSVTVRGLKSASSTTINYKYHVKVVKDGKEEEQTMTRPFTLTIRKVNPTSVTIDQQTNVGWGTTASLNARLNPKYSEAAMIYDSSNPDVVSVSASGKITGNAIGEADVFIRTDNGLETWTHVVVTVPKVSGITITGYDSRMKIYEGEELQLGFQFSPAHAEPEVSWMSTDSGVATVDESGHVTFTGVGTVRIICKDKDGAEGSVKIRTRKKK